MKDVKYVTCTYTEPGVGRLREIGAGQLWACGSLYATYVALGVLLLEEDELESDAELDELELEDEESDVVGAGVGVDESDELVGGGVGAIESESETEVGKLDGTPSRAGPTL